MAEAPTNRIWVVEMYVEIANVWEPVAAALTPEAQRIKLDGKRKQNPDRRYRPVVYVPK